MSWSEYCLTVDNGAFCEGDLFFESIWIKSSTKQAKEFLVEKGYDSKFGARPLKRVIQNQVEDLIAEAYIDGKIKEGDHLVITYKAKDEKLSIK